MVITCKGQGDDDVKRIEVEGDKEKEVIVRHEDVPTKWKTWNYDNISRHWNKKYSV